MKIVFMGNPLFARPTLRALHKSRHKIELAVTGPDRPAGRGRRPKMSPVKELALELKIPLAQPEELSDPEFIERIKAVGPDLSVVVAFRILPSMLLSIPRLGSVNLHASLLPDLRGAAPINWAIIRGYTGTGMTVFFLKKTVDTGDIVLQQEMDIGPEETAGELAERMSESGARLMLDALELIEAGKVDPRPQAGEPTAAPKLAREDGLIPFDKDARSVVNLIRGVIPRPGAYAFLGGRRVIVHRARLIDEGGKAGRPGEIVEATPAGIVTATGEGKVLLTELQMEGKSRLPATEFWRGIRGAEGLRFEPDK